jgi:two-component system sensor histidine kinase/response regulator
MPNPQPAPNDATVLIVDDVPANLQLLVGMLRERGYRPRPVTSGAAALLAAQQSPPDIILLDVNMPEMDGFEVCRRLKHDPQLAEIPVLFVSALNETLDKVKAFAVGGVDYVTKPFQCEEVEARIHAHIELRRRQQVIEDNYRRLRELEALRDNLTQMIVHDMRSPIFALQSIVQVLGPGLAASDPLGGQMLKAARESLFTLKEMATQLLDISRLEAGQMPVCPAPHDLVQTARKACAAYEYSATEKHLALDSPPTVSATYDQDLVRRVIENLLGNALKFSPTGETITITIAHSQDHRTASVSVTDRGPGIEAQHHTRIFEKYAQTGEGRKKHGVGLGLTFCKLAIAAHGGTIGVTSAPGAGSTFWFTLPLPTPAASAPPP